MAVLNSYRCAKCEKVKDAWSDDVPSCHLIRMTWLPMGFYTPEWGGPREYLHLRDEPFASRSELNRYARDNKLSLGESSERVGGARNDMYEGIGKLYSYPGASRRSNSLANLPRRQ